MKCIDVFKCSNITAMHLSYSKKYIPHIAKQYGEEIFFFRVGQIVFTGAIGAILQKIQKQT